MKNNWCILLILFAMFASSNLFGIILTKQEQSNIDANLKVFLTALQTQPSLVFEPTTKQPFDLRGVDLRERNFMNAIITNVNLSDANLSGINMMAAKFTNVNFSSANLSGAKANHTRFWQCNLTNAIFTNAEMQGIQIIGESGRLVQAQNLVSQNANISNGAQFTYVDLRGANMAGCNFHGSALYNITVDDKTSFKGNTDLSMAQLDNWSGYSGSLLSWLRKQVSDEKLLADTSIDGLNTGISQN